MAKLKKQAKPSPKVAVTKISPKIVKSKSKLKKENVVKVPPAVKEPLGVGSLLRNPVANKSKLDRDVVESGVRAMFQLYAKEKETKKELFDEHDSVMLQINCIKVPTGANMTIHVSLMYPLVNKDSEICLIVADDKNAELKEHEKTVEKYEELLKRNGIENIKTIMTYHEMRTEYGQYEMQKRLRQLYDVFLVDGKISGYVNKKLRHQFMKRRKMPISIKLEGPNLKERIEKALMKVDLHVHGKGDSYIAQVGHTGMEEREIVENVFAFYETLDSQFPGGAENLRSLHLKTTRGKSVPVYLTLKNKSEVQVPTIKSKQPKAAKVYEDELSTLDNAKVKVYPSGEVKVIELGDEEENKAGNKKKSKATKGKEVEKVKPSKKMKIEKEDNAIELFNKEAEDSEESGDTDNCSASDELEAIDDEEEDDESDEEEDDEESDDDVLAEEEVKYLQKLAGKKPAQVDNTKKLNGKNVPGKGTHDKNVLNGKQKAFNGKANKNKGNEVKQAAKQHFQTKKQQKAGGETKKDNKRKLNVNEGKPKNDFQSRKFKKAKGAK